MMTVTTIIAAMTHTICIIFMFHRSFWYSPAPYRRARKSLEIPASGAYTHHPPAGRMSPEELPKPAGRMGT